MNNFILHALKRVDLYQFFINIFKTFSKRSTKVVLFSFKILHGYKLSMDTPSKMTYQPTFSKINVIKKSLLILFIAIYFGGFPFFL